MRSSSQRNFATIPEANIPRSVITRNCSYKTTFDNGLLVPVFVDEVLPGDTFSLTMQTFARLATPLHPTMDNIHMSYFFFFVPFRLVWDNWQKFNGEQENPGDPTNFTLPTMTAPGGGYGEQSLSDYFGIPTKVAGIVHHSLFHRSYNLIWNEWFRPEDISDSVVVDKDNGPDDPADYTLLWRAKRHEYFTSCLPWPQKGTAVALPLGTSAPVSIVSMGDDQPTFDIDDATGTKVFSDKSAGEFLKPVSSPTADGNLTWNDPKLEGTADLTAATAATINQIREAFQWQRMYERDARGGTRYTEILRSHFGVTSPDSRLQRPEYLGGGNSYVQISPIPQTSASDLALEAGGSATAQGTLAAMGTSAGRAGFTKSFTEHGCIIGLVATRGDITYQQGMNRMFSRESRFDFYWPSLAHLGEQEVYQREIMMDGSSFDDTVFGYQERYAEYRYKPSLVTGQFRSNATTSLDSWHLAYDFPSHASAQLNNTFMVEAAPVDRIIAVDSEPHFLFDAYFEYRCARPMPTYAVPGLIDHF